MRRAFQRDGTATGKVLRQLDNNEINVAGGESSKRRALKDKAREITEGSYCKDFGL